jgi:hypothetical protein
MGRSFVKFKGYGFWSGDGILLDWLEDAIAELKSMTAPHAWQVEMRNKLEEALASAFTGGIDPELDRLLAGEEQIRFAIDLSKKIGQLTINPKMKRLTELFVELIEGRLKTKVSSPIDYW